MEEILEEYGIAIILMLMGIAVLHGLRMILHVM